MPTHILKKCSYNEHTSTCLYNVRTHESNKRWQNYPRFTENELETYGTSVMEIDKGEIEIEINCPSFLIKEIHVQFE